MNASEKLVLEAALNSHDGYLTLFTTDRRPEPFWSSCKVLVLGYPETGYTEMLVHEAVGCRRDTVQSCLEKGWLTMPYKSPVKVVITEKGRLVLRYALDPSSTSE